MKKLLAAMFVALLMIGCGEDEEPSPAPLNLSTSAVEGKPFAIADLSMDMLWVKPGNFEMGIPLSEKDRFDAESLHTVTLNEGFWLGKYEVTQSQWEKVMGSNPSHFKGVNRPVEKVSWTEVTSFCAKLTALESDAGRLPAGMAYQLPTEAQWEYACRAGTKTAFSFGDYPTGAARDPVGPADGSGRVLRGGSWDFMEYIARFASRRSCPPSATTPWASASVSDRPKSSGGRTAGAAEQRRSLRGERLRPNGAPLFRLCRQCREAGYGRIVA